MKDSCLRIRVQRELRKAFLQACRQHDKPAAQHLREFKRKNVFAHQSAGSNWAHLVKGSRASNTPRGGPK
jgi:cytosine/adenosine deaminase-related metal-dependent hydrolase